MPLSRTLFVAALGCSLVVVAPPLPAQVTGTSPVLATPPAAAQGVDGHLDPGAATQAYLATLPTDKKAKSDAYFEGSYWLILWDFLVAVAIYLIVLGTGLSARMRHAAGRMTRNATLQTVIYWVQFIVVVSVIQLPWSIYEGFVREHRYGLSNLTFGAWFGEQAKGLGVAVVLGAILVVLTPIFNSPKRLTDRRIVAPILRLARQNGIDAKDVWEIDASKQSKRISANVSGALGTERITLNDNRLNRASLEEIEAVMGHEMGHYVLNHIYKGLMEVGILIVIVFALVAWLFERLRVRYEGSWKVRGIADRAGLPLVALLFSAYFFVVTPVLNTIVRTQEYEADVLGLNTARQPDGFAQIAIKLSEYRKLDPGPWEERIFFDHPSGRTRIYAAMRWKAENLATTTPSASSASGSP